MSSFSHALRLLEELRVVVRSLSGPEKARVVEELRGILAVLEKRGQRGKGGLVERIRKAIAEMQAGELAEELPRLRSATAAVLPPQLLAGYCEAFGRDLSPAEEAAIRSLVVELRESDPVAYEQLRELLRAPPPWRLWAVAVLDRAANRRSNIPLRLSTLYAMYHAWRTRDPWWLVEALASMHPDLAERIMQAIEAGDRKLLDRVLAVAYSLPPPQRWSSYTILTEDKIRQLRRLLGPKKEV